MNFFERVGHPELARTVARTMQGSVTPGLESRIDAFSAARRIRRQP